eukprot:CAMPEP_0170616890 /NCGR_PEP_ID=MMETSP0224-20130122/26113_1 /TAXON_ID=285029 /ORGANISM="Togula jolla, Strain CCCM 725" /LENGTH=1202 /DNA_ID=CAMNT_0010942721 /DNA_START=72 /DNA_END=3681 /DNA_ORIENTATION=+
MVPPVVPPVASPMVSLCFGLTPPEYVVLYCVLFVVTVGTYTVRRIRESNKGLAGVRHAIRTSLRGKRVRPSDSLNEAFLKNGPDLEIAENGGVRLALRLDSTAMKQGSLKAGIEDRILESACLAVLMLVQSRRRGGSFCLGLSNGAEDVELEKTSFGQLVKAAKALLEKSSHEDGKPEASFRWQSTGKVEAPGLWTASEEGGDVVIRGTSLEEERSFELCWKACAQNFDLDVWQVQIVSSASLDRVLAFGKAPLDFAAEKDSTGKLMTVPHLIAQQQDSRKGRVAVAGEGFQTSYDELFARAAVVSDLVKQHADPSRSKAVILCMRRGEGTAPAFLGILDAGFYVVPVDTHWPQERIQQVAAECDATVALTEVDSLSLLAGTSLKSFVLDACFYEQMKGKPRSVAKITADDLAVVLFTSGSSGKPKGILLSHNYLSALILGIATRKRMDMSSKTLCYHSPTWMPFLDYLFCPLVVGGACLFFPDVGTHVVKPTELDDFARRHGATQAGFVPAMLDILAENGLPPTLSDVGVGGAAVPSSLCERVFPMLPCRADGSKATLYTGYSGTEVGDVTQMRMQCFSDIDEGLGLNGFMTAGGLHSGQSAALLDAGFNLVGPGAIGEITVAGPGLASGYLNLPEKTAETFLPSCAALGGAAAVRSGDLGRWTNNGCLMLVGRRDTMVKVRGARIELGEVEGTVAAHAAVQACVVTVMDDKLVAYVTPAVPADLRDFCKARLVAYMVPHVFEGLDELPRLPNGKVNKKLLPKPEERSDGAEAVMELDSLGQMRKFTRKAVSEDRVLDNVRAILIGLVLQSHSTPLTEGSMLMKSSTFVPLAASWGPVQIFILQIARSGGWSSLAFLSGFDDTRAMRPYGLTYREPLFLILWLLLDFNWTMWYLPVFAAMRACFCLMHHLGLQKVHMVVASQIWILLPAFVDFYIGWDPSAPAEQCPSQCVCPWQWSWARPFSQSGWWVAGPDPQRNSFVGHALIFIPCYWIGFYQGGRIFKVLTAIADEPSWLRSALIAVASLVIYYIMFALGAIVVQDFDDRCASFWGPEGSFVWFQVAQNVTYYAFNLLSSLLWVVFIASAVPIHLKYLAKVCFASLIVSGLVPCVLDTPSQALVLRGLMPESISPGVEISWTFFVPFLFELVVGAVITTLLPIIIKAGMRAYAKIKKSLDTWIRLKLASDFSAERIACSACLAMDEL